VVTELRPSQLDLSSVFNYMFIMVFVVMMFKMVDRALEPEHPKMLYPGKIPSGYKPVHHSSGGISERKLQELIGEVPDVNDPDRICYWVEADDEMVYLEGWCDKCLIGTGFPTIEAGNHEEKIDYIKDITEETLKRKAKERGLRLIRGGFVETIGPPYYTANLYGVSYGIYQKAEEHHLSGEAKKLVFIGSCKISEGLCITHGYSVSKTVRCPKSPLTDEEWKAAWELVETAFPEGMSNPWVNGWWPETLEEAEKAVDHYAYKMRDAVWVFREKQRKAVENYEMAADKAIHNYRQYVMVEYERRPKEAGVTRAW
jgi:hypothetical protein